MAKDPFEQFVVPNEMRSFAEQSIAQARKAFDGFMQAGGQATGRLEDQAKAARGGAHEIAHQSMSFAEQSLTASFDFAQGLIRAKDAAEIMGLQSEYLSRQLQALSSQVQALGHTAAKLVIDAAKLKT